MLELPNNNIPERKWEIYEFYIHHTYIPTVTLPTSNTNAQSLTNTFDRHRPFGIQQFFFTSLDYSLDFDD
jgi:hypothetical protein